MIAAGGITVGKEFPKIPHQSNVLFYPLKYNLQVLCKLFVVIYHTIYSR